VLDVTFSDAITIENARNMAVVRYFAYALIWIRSPVDRLMLPRKGYPSPLFQPGWGIWECACACFHPTSAGLALSPGLTKYKEAARGDLSILTGGFYAGEPFPSKVANATAGRHSAGLMTSLSPFKSCSACSISLRKPPNMSWCFATKAMTSTLSRTVSSSASCAT
jgi:hypothetical protein